MKKSTLIYLLTSMILLCLVSPVIATPLTYSGQLFDGMTVYGTTLDGQDWWSFNGVAGDTVTITLDRVANQPDGSGTLDPYVVLYFGDNDATYTFLTADDDGGSDTPAGPFWNSLISGFSLTDTGTYSVLASYAIGSGPYALTLDGSGGAPVPEPSTLLLLGAGLGGLALYRRKTKK